MKNLLIKNIVSVVNGIWLGPSSTLEKEISSVSIDSRKITPDCLFVAIPGEKYDGHQFVLSALEQGALCALVQHIPENQSKNLILVPNTLQALQAIAEFYRSQFDIPVLGITGSVGKTTAKEMVFSVLAQHYCVHKTAGNFNNDLGVPITLLGLTEKHEIAVIEMGISHPGDMERLAKMVRPTMSLFTIIGDAHLQYLKNREGVLAEKSIVNQYIPSDGYVFCSGDDQLLVAMKCAQRKITFGLSNSCDLYAEAIDSLPDGTIHCNIVGMGRCISIVIPAFGDHMIYAALEGAAVGICMGLSDREIATGIASYSTTEQRSNKNVYGTITLIDDCYNANPTSTANAIRSLSHCKGRTVCILGDMLELGENSDRLHREIGTLAASCGIDLVITQGIYSKETAIGAAQINHYFREKKELINSLPNLIIDGDTVLVKASRGMQFEEISEILKRLRPNK